MNIKFISFIFFTCLITFSCKKESGPPIDVSKIDVSGITEADISGSSIGTVDNTDWNKDITWTADESALFQAPPSSQVDTAQKADVNFLFAYPNPVQTSVTFFFEIDKGYPGRNSYN